jgi:GntR family transcriptional regulator, transcriptional repressor for pyruvate dehydrogenase complex
MIGTVPRRKIREVVAQRLKDFISSEKLRPGDRLPTENQLADQFGVSRLSLREATKALEFLGIVEARPGRGLSVGHVTLERMTEYLGFHPALQDASPVQLIETRIIIETGVLPQVIQRMREDAAIEDALSSINDRLRGARTVQRWVQHDIAFHRCLLESSGLSPLIVFNDLLAVFFNRFRESVKKAEWQGGIDSHQRLIDHLSRGQLDAACSELRDHIDSHRHRT